MHSVELKVCQQVSSKEGLKWLCRNNWPWLAAFVYTSKDPAINGKFFCGATLLSMKSVITAAHCMQEKHTETRMNPSDVEVHLGRHNLSDDSEINKLAKVLPHIVIIAMPSRLEANGLFKLPIRRWHRVANCCKRHRTYTFYHQFVFKIASFLTSMESSLVGDSRAMRRKRLKT